MKQITSHELSIAINNQQQGTVEQQQAVSLTSKVIDHLFNSLKAIYPAWHSAYPTIELEKLAKVTWLKAFDENDIRTASQLKLGLIVARKSESPFMPSVGQFISWIKSADIEMLGMPSLEEYRCIVKKLMACPGIFNQKYPEYIEKYGEVTDLEYWLLSDSYDVYKKSDESTINKNLKAVYDKWLHKLRNNEPVPERKVLITEKPEPRELSQEELKKAIQEMRKTVLRGAA